MRFWDDLRSGKFLMYAKTAAFICIAVLVIIGAFFIGSIISAIFSFAFAGVMMILEIPFCQWCCMNPTTSKIIAFFTHPLLRAFLYTVMATIEFVLVFHAGQSQIFILPAVLLCVTTILYLLGAFKKEHKQPANGENAPPGTPGMDKERPSNPAGAGYANVV